MESYNKVRAMVIEEISISLSAVDESCLEQMTSMICSAEKVFVIGVGRVLLMLQAFVKRLNHLGIEANFVGAVNEPAITEKDVLIVGSGSGETAIPVAIVKIAKMYKARIIHICSNANSSLKDITDLFLRIPCRTKLNLSDEIPSKQPMSSLFEQSLLILGDIIACMIIERKNLDLKTLWHKHANLE